MGCEQNLRESRVNVILLFIIFMKREISEWQFSTFSVILSEKMRNFSVISMKSLKFRNLGINGNSWNRAEVTRDSMNWLKLFSSMNIPWKWIQFTDPSIASIRFLPWIWFRMVCSLFDELQKEFIDKTVFFHSFVQYGLDEKYMVLLLLLNFWTIFHILDENRKI